MTVLVTKSIARWNCLWWWTSQTARWNCFLKVL